MKRVGVPPDACFRTVLGDQHVLQLLRFQAGERRGGRAEREEEVGDVVSLSQVACREVALPACR
jgi:hypothetical protein